METLNKKLSEMMLAGFEKKLTFTQSERDKLGYMLRVLMSEGEKLVLLLGLALCFHVLSEFLIAFLAMTLSRSFVGGIHRDTYWGCLLHTVLYFTVVLLLAEYVTAFNVYPFFGLFAVLICLTDPVTAKQRGKISERRRKRLKRYAMLGLCICLLMCVMLPPYEKVVFYAILIVHLEHLLVVMQERRRSVCWE